MKIRDVNTVVGQGVEVVKHKELEFLTYKTASWDEPGAAPVSHCKTILLELVGDHPFKLNQIVYLDGYAVHGWGNTWVVSDVVGNNVVLKLC